MKLTTLCYLIDDGKVLLAMKKRGFGAGKMNGPGGKVMEGETVADACRREFLEETDCGFESLEPRGIIEFVFRDKPDWDNTCHIFVAKVPLGVPKETEEMLPDWYAVDALPLDRMWEDDAVWLPDVLAGGAVAERFYFDSEGKLLSHEAT